MEEVMSSLNERRTSRPQAPFQELLSLIGSPSHSSFLGFINHINTNVLES